MILSRSEHLSLHNKDIPKNPEHRQKLVENLNRVRLLRNKKVST